MHNVENELEKMKRKLDKALIEISEIVNAINWILVPHISLVIHESNDKVGYNMSKYLTALSTFQDSEKVNKGQFDMLLSTWWLPVILPDLILNHNRDLA